MLADPFELIKKISSGLMLVGRGGEKVDNLKTIFLIKEEYEYIESLKKHNPIIQLRIGYYTINNVKAICIMAKFGSDMLYDGWLNYHNYNGKKVFNDLEVQENLIFKFYNSNECLRTLAIPNKLKSQFSKYLSDIKTINVWSMQDFDIVKNNIYKKYPNGSILWDSLK